MSSDPQKVPLVQTTQANAYQRALDAIAQLGQAIPCHVTARSGQIVTVAFDVAGDGATLPPVTIPIATSIYDWMPLQNGDKGYTAVASVYLGGVSGLGGGTASLTQPSNLTALVFVPVSNTTWGAPDTNQRVVQGPDGVLIQTISGGSSVNVTTSAVTITVGGKVWVFNSSGLTLSNGIVAEPHEHGGVEAGGSNTSGPVNP